MTNHCISCGADVSDLGVQVCPNCLVKQKFNRAIKKTLKKQKIGKKECKKTFKTFLEMLSWHKEKQAYKYLLRKYRAEFNNLKWANDLLENENRALKNHVERLLEFTELTPEQANEWINNKNI